MRLKTSWFSDATKWIRALGAAVGLRGAAFVLGLALLWRGLDMVSPPLPFIVVGGLWIILTVASFALQRWPRKEL